MIAFRKRVALLLSLVLILSVLAPVASHAATEDHDSMRDSIGLVTVPPITTTPSAMPVSITREQYNAFGGIRHTSNNSTRPLGAGVTFVADNNVHLEWYIRVTGGWTGTMEVAYQIGSRHYMQTLAINAPGRYRIGDSRGSNGLNEIRIGVSYPPLPPLLPRPTPEPTPDLDPDPDANPNPAPNPNPTPTPDPTPIPNMSIRDFTREDIAYSQMYENFRFIKGEILISATLQTPYDLIYNLMNYHGGEIVGYLSVPNEFQVCFGRERPEAELWALIDIFNANDMITLATLNLASSVGRYHRVPVGELDTHRSPFAAAIDTPGPPSNDALWANQWDGFWRGYAGGLNWGMEVIEAPYAWRYNHIMEENRVRVGIIDGCFDAAHDDLEFIRILGGGENAVSVTEPSHGTMVAGVIAGLADNEIGIAGVAWHVDLYGYARTNDEFRMVSNVFSLFTKKHAVASLFADDVNIINISLGHGNVFARMGNDKTPDEIKFLVVEGLSLGVFLQKYVDLHYDFVIVNSAGNESNFIFLDGSASGWTDSRYNGWLTNIPIDYRSDGVFPDLPNDIFPDVVSRIIVVGNLGTSTHLAGFVAPDATGFSSYAPEYAYRGNIGSFRIVGSSQVGCRVDIFAPGEFILTTSRNNEYTMFNGTSSAAPHVTGVVAMVWALNPNLTGYEVKDIVVTSNHDHMVITLREDLTILGGGADPRRRFPILNAGNAVAAAMQSGNGAGDDNGDDDIILPTVLMGRVMHELPVMYGLYIPFGVGNVEVRLYCNDTSELLATEITHSAIDPNNHLGYDVGHFNFMLEDGRYTLVFYRADIGSIPWNEVIIINSESPSVVNSEFSLQIPAAPHEVHVQGEYINYIYGFPNPPDSPGRYALSIRAVAAAAGYTVSWDAVARIITLERDDSPLKRVLSVGSNEVELIRREDGSAYGTFIIRGNTVPFFHNNRVYLRYDVLAETLELNVEAFLHQGSNGGHFRFTFS